MFRPLLFAGSVVTLAMLMASSAHAQFGRNIRLPPAVQNIMMLRGEAVQKELTIADDQRKAIDEIAGQMQSDAMEIFSGLQDLTPEEREKELPNLMKMMTDKSKDLQAKVDKVLNPKQQGRLKELSIQQRGAEAFEDEEVASALKLSDEQKNKLTSIRDEANEKQQEIVRGLTSGEGGDRAAAMEKMQALRKELSDKALTVLSSEQRAAFEKMKGEKFDFPKRRGPF